MLPKPTIPTRSVCLVSILLSFHAYRADINFQYIIIHHILQYFKGVNAYLVILAKKLSCGEKAQDIGTGGAAI
jgi:hypothetical protein